MTSKPIKLIEDTISEDDVKQLCDWLLQSPTPRLTKGPKTIEYEAAYAKGCDRKYAVFVSSGSSANLLAVYALIAAGRLKNNKVVVPSLAWATTVAPVIQFNLKPILCDVNLVNLGVSIFELEQILKRESPALLIIVTILGMPSNMEMITTLCLQYDVILVVDNCESQNSFYEHKRIEKYGLMSTCSSYMGHITSTIEGGMVTTDDEEIYNMLKMLRSHGWTRDLSQRLQRKYNRDYNIPAFNQAYTFFYPGFNARSTDVNAFLGLLQLKKLNDYTYKRDSNFRSYRNLINNDFWRPFLPVSAIISNLGFPVIHPSRDRIAADLTAHHVENRPLISGAMNLQPFFINYCESNKVEHPPMPVAEMITKYGMYIPNHPGLTYQDIEFISNIINKHTDHDSK